jgi:hypothetical protein
LGSADPYSALTTAINKKEIRGLPGQNPAMRGMRRRLPLADCLAAVNWPLNCTSRIRDITRLIDLNQFQKVFSQFKDESYSTALSVCLISVERS